jgi:glycerol-3-phosphate acyltransferase PlsY
MNWVLEITFICLSYLLGSVPFGYILTYYYTDKNILEQGSGNIGSTNVKRVAGRKIAIITQLLDMLKGLLPVAVYILFLKNDNAEFDYFIYGLALAAILGHDFSIFLKFKGGKGVNTTLGASVLIAPISVIISVAIYFVVKFQFKYVSLGSIILSIFLPLSEALIYGFTSTFFYLLLCMILIILLHRKNIIRLINKQELPS